MFKQPKLAAIYFLIALGLVGSGFGTGVVYTEWATKSSTDFSSLAKIQKLLKQKFDGEIYDNKLLDGAKAGLVAAAGDPYTAYLTPEEAKQLQDDLNGTLSGIGAEIGQKDGQLIVVSPLVASPAEAAGIRAGDIIVTIDDADASKLSVAQAVLKIRGKEGTKVKLRLVRGNKPFEVTIRRQVINVPSVKSEMKGEIGYIKISRFGSDTGTKLGAAARQLKADGAQKILLDLRNNPGGYLDTAVDVASHFLAEDTVVVEERRFGQTEKILKAEAGGELIGLPLVVLINGGSASASEIVAGALQDHGKAKVVGEDSFGKGSVQDIVKLDGGSQLKITIAHWFTPRGRNITKEGIKPAAVIKQPDDDNSLTDPQLDAALRLLK